MRAFIAIDCNSQKDYFKGIQQKIMDDSAVMKMTDDFHLTLRFLGDITDKESDKILSRLEGLVFRPFRISLGSIGFFPNDSCIKVIWLGIKDNDDRVWDKKT